MQIHCLEFDVSSFPYALSDDLLDYCITLDRTLTLNCGHVFIAGASDKFNRSVPSLIAHMHNYRCFSLKVSSNYHIKNFSIDVKQAVTYVTLESEPALLLIEDFQLLDPTFLQYINQLLSTGYVPGLFSKQEFEQMSGQLRDLASNESFDGELMSYFASSKFIVKDIINFGVRVLKFFVFRN